MLLMLRESPSDDFNIFKSFLRLPLLPGLDIQRHHLVGGATP